MNHNTGPVDYPTLIICGFIGLLNILGGMFEHLTANGIFHFIQYLTVAIGFILSLARLVDYIKLKFIKRKN